MKKLYHLLFLASITVIAVGCGEKFIDADRTLNVHEKAITLTDAEQSKPIKVETDKENSYTATWQGGDWGRVEKQDDGIIINVNANNAKNNRKATIHVALEKGGKVEIVTITQNGEEAMLDAIPSELTFNQLVGSKDITLFTNQSDWAVEVPSTDWSTVTPDRIRGILTVDVLENTVEADRSFTIKLSSAASGLSKDIKITQSGIATYIIPFLKFGAPGHEMLAFEEERGSTYLRGSSPYLLGTLSKVMPDVRYNTENDRYTIRISEIYYKDSFDKDVYAKVIGDIDYEYAFIEPTMWGDTEIFWRESDKTYAGIFVDAGYVAFARLDKKPNNSVQDKPMPSFETFPLGFHTMTANFDAVRAWEAENGGTVNEKLSDESSLVFLTGTTPIAARIYIMDGTQGLPGVTKITTVVTDLSFIMYPCVYTNIITNEFQALLDQGGFEPTEYSAPSKSYFYQHKAKNLLLSVFEFHFVDLPGLEGQKSICLTYNPLSAPEGFSSVWSAPSASETKPTPFRDKKMGSLKNIAR